MHRGWNAAVDVCDDLCMGQFAYILHSRFAHTKAIPLDRLFPATDLLYQRSTGKECYGFVTLCDDSMIA